MDIAFILPRPFQDDYYVTVFTTEILKFLSRKHRLAVVNYRGKLKTRLFPERNKRKNAHIKPADADIILVQDVFGLKLANGSFAKRGVPIVFISHSNVWSAQPFLCKNLLKILSLSHDHEILKLPQELTQYFGKPVFTNGMKGKRKKDLNSALITAVHFYQYSDADLSVVKTIVKAVNSILDIQLTVVAPKEIAVILETLGNHNVSIVDKSRFNERDLVNFDLAVVSDYHALRTLFLGMPTLLVGNRGLGGFLSSHNIADHLNWHFAGRLGAEINENTPITLLAAELKNVRMRYSEISHETERASAIIRKSLDAGKIFLLMEKEISAAFNLYKKVLSDKYHLLKPKRIKQVQAIQGTQSNIYIVQGNNKIVGSISEEANNVFENCQGKETLLQLASHSNLNVDSLGAFIKELWYEKVVVFEK